MSELLRGHGPEILETEIVKLEAQSAAQLAELTAISEALGTNEGHSSVDHIKALQAKVAELGQLVERSSQEHCTAAVENEALRTRVAELAEQVEADRRDAEKWKQIAEFQYAKRMYPGKLELGQGALDAYAKKWTTYEAALASRPERKEQPIEETVEVPCCGYKASINDHPVKWNPWNKVVQCHNCGQIWEALVKQSDRKPDEPNGGAK